jgi:esterase
VILTTLELGAGERPTVLLHGFLGSGKNLRTLAQRWSERDAARRFLLPDLPGHGTSPPVSERTDLREMADAVIETARSRGLTGPLEIVGHSLGGRVGLAATLTAPGEVSALTLLDITPSPIRTEVSESGRVMEFLLRAPGEASDRRVLRQSLIDAGLSAALTDWLMMNVAHEGNRHRWRIDREALARLHARVNAEDLWEAVERPGATVRCIRGGRSDYVPEGDVERMERAGCPVLTLPSSGHYVHVDALDEVAALLAVTKRG